MPDVTAMCVLSDDCDYPYYVSWKFCSVVRGVGVLVLAHVLHHVVGRHRPAAADVTVVLARARALVLVLVTETASLQSHSHALSEDP
jgi:hypothetical protein